MAGVRVDLMDYKRNEHKSLKEHDIFKLPISCGVTSSSEHQKLRNAPISMSKELSIRKKRTRANLTTL